MKYSLGRFSEKPGFFTRLFGHVPANTVFINDGSSLAAALLHGEELEICIDGKCVQRGVPAKVFAEPASAAVATLLWHEANIIDGKIISTGAGEFFAESPAGEIHGKLLGTEQDADIPAGTKIQIFIKPETLQISDCPPDENFFPLDPNDAGTITFDGKVRMREFTLSSGAKLRIASLSRQALVLADDAFAWAFPEDIVGFIEE